MKAYQVDLELYLNVFISEFIKKLKEGILENNIVGVEAIEDFINSFLSRIDKSDFQVIERKNPFGTIVKSFIQETFESLSVKQKITSTEYNTLCEWLDNKFNELSGSLTNSYV